MKLVTTKTAYKWYFWIEVLIMAFGICQLICLCLAYVMVDIWGVWIGFGRTEKVHLHGRCDSLCHLESWVDIYVNIGIKMYNSGVHSFVMRPVDTMR